MVVWPSIVSIVLSRPDFLDSDAARTTMAQQERDMEFLRMQAMRDQEEKEECRRQIQLLIEENFATSEEQPDKASPGFERLIDPHQRRLTDPHRRRLIDPHLRRLIDPLSRRLQDHHSSLRLQGSRPQRSTMKTFDIKVVIEGRCESLELKPMESEQNLWKMVLVREDFQEAEEELISNGRVIGLVMTYVDDHSHCGRGECRQDACPEVSGHMGHHSTRMGG